LNGPEALIYNNFIDEFKERVLIFDKTGLVRDDVYVTGFAWSPVYLLACEHPLLFEAGFYCMGNYYERGIREVLREKTPEMLFLTHVHYDHCGAAQHMKEAFPGLTIAASSRAAELARRPNAQALMTELSRNVIGLIEGMDGIDREMILRDQLSRFDIDVALADGLTVPVQENLSVQVLSTPGHTRDMLSYYIPERKILFATEAAGCLNRVGQTMTEFLVDYDEYMRSLQRLADLDVDMLCQGHHFVFTDSDVHRHFERSIKAAEEFKDNAESLLETEQGSVDRVVSLIKAREYDSNPGPKQPERAYLINLRTRVAHLAERQSKAEYKC
jgi:glyoxylase-like metal-dependent hydrolase (beta-lactamase superfamily II)